MNYNNNSSNNNSNSNNNNNNKGIMIVVIIILGRGAWGPGLRFEGFSGSSHSGLCVWGCRGQSLRSSLRGA